MSATTSTERHGLPAVLDFDKVFVTVFWVLSEEYDVTLPNVASNVSWDEYDPAEVRRLFDDAIDATLSALAVTPPAGDNLDWLGHLHELVFKSAPPLEKYFADTTDQE